MRIVAGIHLKYRFNAAAIPGRFSCCIVRICISKQQMNGCWVDVSYWHIPVCAPHGCWVGGCQLLTHSSLCSPFHFSLMMFCSKLTESVRRMACVVWLWPLEAVQRRAWVTVSPSLSSWRLRLCRLLCRHGWPWWTVKPHPDWSLVTIVYNVRSCVLLLFFCLFLFWGTWSLTPFCLLAVHDGAFPNCLAGISHRDTRTGFVFIPVPYKAFIERYTFNSLPVGVITFTYLSRIDKKKKKLI